jgi:hypothetical protein
MNKIKLLQSDIKRIKIIAILLVAAIFISSLYILFLPKHPHLKEEKKEGKEKTFDDRISPLTDQALFFEIKRVRRRGLEEEMRKFGRDLPKPNPYYFVIEIDGKEYDGSKIEAVQGSGSGTLTVWDTGYGYGKIIRDVEEEQEKSEVTLKIMEIQEKGILFFKRKASVELESIHLVYDYKTGRWEGDDYFNDSDGYGHYFGENCEIWFEIHQTDYDRDGIPYWTEVNVLGTDPKVDDSKLDPDNDGIPTSWEWKWGYDPFEYNNHSTLDPDVDGLSNVVEYNLEKWLADPFYKDIFIEVDGMEGSGKRKDFPYYMLPEESQQMIMDKFARHAITLHIDDGCMGGGGELFPFVESISQESGLLQKYYKYHFSDDRKGVFHYAVIAYASGFCHPQDYGNRYDVFTISGSKEVFSHVFMPYPRYRFNPRTFYIWMASLFMHELGHSLGLMPAPWYCGGVDNISMVPGRLPDNMSFIEKMRARNEAIEYWADYVSCMNYGNSGGPLKGILKPSYAWIVLDYSDGTHGEHDYDDWSHIDLTYFQKAAPFIEESFES